MGFFRLLLFILPIIVIIGIVVYFIRRLEVKKELKAIEEREKLELRKSILEYEYLLEKEKSKNKQSD